MVASMAMTSDPTDTLRRAWAAALVREDRVSMITIAARICANCKIRECDASLRRSCR